MPHRRPRTPRVIAEAGELRVEADPERTSVRRLIQDGMEASSVDLADLRDLQFDYLRWMRIALSAVRARRVLHIGGAAAALPRALAAADPDGRQEVWEIDPAVLSIARAHLGLARMPGLRVRVGDGTRALLADGPLRDAVVIDAFLGARVASGPTSVEALAGAARLAPLSLVNVVDHRGGGEVARVADGLAGAYPHVLEIRGRSSNSVLVGHRLARLELGSALARDPSPAGVSRR